MPSGMSTDDQIALITNRRGFNVETFASLEDVLRSLAYRVCAEKGYTTEALDKIVAETRDQIAIDTGAP